MKKFFLKGEIVILTDKKKNEQSQFVTAQIKPLPNMSETVCICTSFSIKTKKKVRT